MKTRILAACMSLLAVLVSPLAAAKNAEESIQRFSLIAGSNYGGPDRPRLRYAVSDARSVMKVLTTMGGVNLPDCTLLVEPGKEQFRTGLEDIRNRILQVGKTMRRVEFIFYYSGHADEEGLLLGREKMSYREIRKSIEHMPADVRIAILDSCSSGAFTRMKGGKMHAPFMVDSSYSMKGYAFLTSSSADEASQESEKIKGSFFTHFLVSGLLGAADMNEDKRITLNEAYQFAYSETLARTEKTYGGPQHPNYHIQMTGTGDVIITDIRRRTAGLVVGKEVSGRLFIRDRERTLVAELTKPPGRTITLMLDDGKYTVLNEKDGKLFESDITLRRDYSSVLNNRNFVEVKPEFAVARGGQKDEKAANEEYKLNKYKFSLFPLKEGDGKTVCKFSFSVFGSYCTRLEGLDLGIGLGIVEEDAKWAQINGAANYVERDFKGLQLSYLLNYVRRDASGVQFTSIGNYVGGNSDYVQASSVFCYTGRDFNGVQMTGITNIAGGAVRGLQLSAVVNYAGSDLNGMQASVVNIAGNTAGMQFGVVNIADKTKGMQLGIVNIADDFKGTQWGIVNIADKMDGFPLGIINIADNGAVGMVGWWSSPPFNAANFGVRFRVNNFYTMLAAGGKNMDRDGAIEKSVTSQFFMGFRVDLWKYTDDADAKSHGLYLDCDAGFLHIDNDPLYGENASSDQMAIQGRVMIGVTIAGGLSVFGGGGAGYLWDYGEFSDGRYEPLYVAGAAFEF